MVKQSGPLAVSIEEAAALIGVSRNTAYALAREGKLPVVRIGLRRLVVPMDRLQAMLNPENATDGHSATEPPAA